MASPQNEHSDSTSNPPEDNFRYVHSTDLPSLFEQLKVSLFVTTYQAGKLLVFRASNDKLSMLVRTFGKAMGLSVGPQKLALGTKNQVWFFRNDPSIAPQLEPRGQHDACFISRSSHVTGDISIHELAQSANDLWAVNTRFSCLCTLNDDYSFVPRWRPPFISALAAEDRCHLNGMAVVEGQPKYVTVLGNTDSAQGWRENKDGGGCVIDVASGEFVARGLSMPHSPRLHQGRLWVLNSGHGALSTIDVATGCVEQVAELPGYARGLTFHDRFAFVGLSKIRETSTFGGLPISEKRSELKCGVWVIDIITGQTVGFVEFEKSVEEIFDVQILPGIRFPAVIGLEKDTIDGVFTIPSDMLTTGNKDN